jgi:hypothetical protein
MGMFPRKYSEDIPIDDTIEQALEYNTPSMEEEHPFQVPPEEP